MAGVKISALPAAGAITGSELVPVVQSGDTVQTTPAAIRTYALTSPTFINSAGIGGISTAYLFSVAGLMTSNATVGGINISSTIEDSVTSNAYGVLANPTTEATGFTLPNFRGFQAGISLGAGSAVTNAIGFAASSSLGSNATNGYGFFSELAAGTGKWNFYATGTAANYMAGSLGIGSTSLTAIGLRVSKSITGGTTAFGVLSDGTISSDVTGTAVLVRTSAITAVASFTLANLIYHQAVQGTFGAGSVVTAQSGFVADASLIGGTSNYGFRGQIPAATGRWNVYMDGTAQNYILGNVGIGTGKTVPAFPLDVAGQIRGTYVGGVPANTLSAAGANLGAATGLTAQYNVVTGVSSGQGVRLPDVIGVPIWVFNNQASFALLVYPSTVSQTINALGAGVGFSLAAAGKIELIQVAANVWYTMT